MYRLVFLNGKMKGRRVAVQQGSITIGRDPACHIDLAYDDEVSRQHATLEQRPDGVYVKDLGAMNPVEVNGKKITEQKLKHGDKLEVGRTQFEFQNIEEANVGARRTMSTVQGVTFVAIASIVLVQIVFVFVLPMLRQPPTGLPKHAAKTSDVPAQVAAAAPAATNEAKPSSFEQVVSDIQSRPPQPSVTATDEVTAEVKQLRDALKELQQQLADLNQQSAQLTNANAQPAPNLSEAHGSGPAAPVESQVIETTANLARVEQPLATGAQTEAAAPVVSVAPTQAAPVAQAPGDALLQKAKDLLAEATQLMSQNRFEDADSTLERVQVLAPDFTPSYVERARLYESRGFLGKAGEQWTKVMDMSVGTPLYEQAAAERQRLARAELIQTMTSDKDDTGGGNVGDQKMARRIRIINVEREKFDANQEFDEMRLLRINVKPRMSEGEMEPSDFVCQVVFYDRGIFKQTIRPTRAVAPKDALKVDGTWPAGEQRTLTAAYIVPKNFRDEEEKSVGERRTYEGYRVLIYYKGILQDETALPKTLADLPPPAPPEKTGK